MATLNTNQNVYWKNIEILLFNMNTMADGLMSGIVEINKVLTNSLAQKVPKKPQTAVS